MATERLKRINALAAKEKAEGLTDEEKAEQKRLRDAYRFAFRASLTQQLEHTYIMEPDGSKHKFGTPPKKRHK